MDLSLLKLLRCPVTRSSLQMEVISKSRKKFDTGDEEIIQQGILFSESDWFYPVIDGIPRLLIEAFYDYADFFRKNLPDYERRKSVLEKKYNRLITQVVKKNRRTKQSFAKEWSVFKYDSDKTWDLDQDGMLGRFLKETDEKPETLKGKFILDAGCGNGVLNRIIATHGAFILGMDVSSSVEKAFTYNDQKRAYFIQGDVQFPPVDFGIFDIVHSSGVLHHTNNTELSFSCLEPCVKTGGKMSVWLYHPRQDFVHKTFNILRRITSRLPVKMQYPLYAATLFPLTVVTDRLKGRRKNARETMVNILDWFSPEFRFEHEPDEVASWFYKRHYTSVKVTTSDLFGFNMVGNKIRENANRDF